METRTPSWEDEYERLIPIYNRLREEVLFAIDAAIIEENIKVHTLTGRVKSIESLREKAERKAYTAPLDQSPDLVGIRVVVLFLNDLARVAKIIETSFDVLATEDKVHGADDPSTFGYMSQHFDAQLGDGWVGPRYKNLRGVRFEVQVRTLLMDAWANVSHYLAYKGESSIPPELRKDFYALSGLFYVADRHFEMLAKGSTDAQAEAERRLAGEDPDVALNLESLLAYLTRRYPDRKRSSRAAVGELANELLTFGYSTVAELDRMLSAREEDFLAEEKERPPHATPSGRFADVGAVRVSLSIEQPGYLEYLLAQVDDEDDGGDGDEDEDD